mmetsp:Transcript_14794/g.58031  ORF Transcript_14794/g.58031 Transcript_14794/m.58031 type:complete len:176 (+) Transcript_14794:68-595(+)
MSVEKKTLEEGNGRWYPGEGDEVYVHYTGCLSSGEQFDSSVGKRPFAFTIGSGQVIQGWDLGIPKLSLGEKATLTVPSKLGYGSGGVPDAIPPNSVLVFTVELLAINGHFSISRANSYCSGCLKETSNVKACSACRMVSYCARDCQKRSWRKHKSKCSYWAEKRQRAQLRVLQGE